MTELTMVTSENLVKGLPGLQANLEQIQDELIWLDRQDLNKIFPEKVMQNPKFIKALEDFRANAYIARHALAMFENMAVNLVKVLKEAEDA